MDKTFLKKSEILNCIYKSICNNADIFGKIDRKRLYKVLGIVYHIPKEKKQAVIRELKEYGVLIESNKFNFTINKNLNKIIVGSD